MNMLITGELLGFTVKIVFRFKGTLSDVVRHTFDKMLQSLL